MKLSDLCAFLHLVASQTVKGNNTGHSSRHSRQAHCTSSRHSLCRQSTSLYCHLLYCHSDSVPRILYLTLGTHVNILLITSSNSECGIHVTPCTITGVSIVGMQHQFRANFLVEFFWRKESKCHRGLFQGGCLLMGRLGAFSNICEETRDQIADHSAKSKLDPLS